METLSSSEERNYKIRLVVSTEPVGPPPATKTVHVGPPSTARTGTEFPQPAARIEPASRRKRELK